jgi:hypothetical protein
MKRDIGKIIASGSANKRALLLAEVIAHHRLHREMLISEGEYQLLMKSFKTPREIKIYQRFKTLNELVPVALNVYQGGHVEAMQKVTRLKGALRYWHGLEEAEKLVNIVLAKTTQDIETRKQIVSSLVDVSGFWYAYPEVDPEGYLYLDLNIKEEPKIGIKRLAELYKESLIPVAIRQASWREAFRDVMLEEGFKIEAYSSIIEGLHNELKKELSLWGRNNDPEKDSLDRFWGDHPRRDSILERVYKYAIDLDTIKPSLNDYEYFRENFLIRSVDEDR